MRAGDEVPHPVGVGRIDRPVEQVRRPADSSGFGVETDEAVVRERAGDVNRHTPVRRHEDGSVAEW
ncbi:hypothetical protein BRD03_10085 [Halobacteriales archaeon QS_9_68_17]|nr:MAG: hypothetical protein BRD03_10085 [Halobacteriales archaeon QS_9_68_17]